MRTALIQGLVHSLVRDKTSLAWRMFEMTSCWRYIRYEHGAVHRWGWSEPRQDSTGLGHTEVRREHVTCLQCLAVRP